MNKYTINLVLGDVSGDGHQQSHTETILSNLDVHDFLNAYTKGSTLAGVDITELCKDYEDNIIPEEDIAKLKKAGLDFAISDGIWIQEFVAIYLFIVKLGDSSFTYEDLDKENTIKIGGYGIFG